MARKNYMNDNFLSISTPIETDSVTNSDGVAFNVVTEDVTLHTHPDSQRYFEIFFEEPLSKQRTTIAKYSVDLQKHPKISDEEDRKWIARNIHYHTCAVIIGDIDQYTLGEWVNQKAVFEVVKRGEKDLPRDPSFDGHPDVEVVTWL